MSIHIIYYVYYILSVLNLIFYEKCKCRRVMDILSRLAFSPFSKSSSLKDDLLMIVRKQVGKSSKKDDKV